MDTSANAPRIRFEGFSGNWEEQTFRDGFDLMPNNTLSRAELCNMAEGTRNIHYGDILVKFGEIIDASKDSLPSIADEKKAAKCTTLKDGDVIIADTAEDSTVGKCAELIGVSNAKVVAGLHTIPCRPRKNFAPGYLGYFMNSSAYHDQLIPLMQGIKVTSVSKTALQDTILRYPQETEEQRQIGQYFRNLDNLITLQQRKLETLKETKKAMLQKMFPQEGQTVPEVRFEGFNGEWEQRKCGDILEERNIQHPQSEEFPLVSFTVENGVTPKTERYEREQLVRGDKAAKKYKETRLNDIVYNPANLKFGAIARNKYGNAVFSPIYVTYEVDMKIATPSFVELCVTREDFIQNALQYQQGTVYERMAVNTEDLAKLDISIPSIEEQNKIGRYFEHLDTLISLQQRKLETLQQIKKGMLQQMFV